MSSGTPAKCSKNTKECVLEEAHNIRGDIKRLQNRACEVSYIIKTTKKAIDQHPRRPDMFLYLAHLQEMEFLLSRIEAKVSVCQGKLDTVLQQIYDYLQKID